MNAEDNLQFIPKLIDTVCIRPGEGTNLRIAIGTIQRIAALRAYNGYGNCRDWMEKLSTAYVVALATRSADALLMRYIQNDLNGYLSIVCSKCRDTSIGTPLIRERLFPDLKSLRKHANVLIHHLDEPSNNGISGLNIEGVLTTATICSKKISMLYLASFRIRMASLNTRSAKNADGNSG